MTEWRSSTTQHDHAEAMWTVRVLLAAALARALRAGLSKSDICELLRELESQGDGDV